MRQKVILLIFILLVLLAGFFPACVAEESPALSSAPGISGVFGTAPLLFEGSETASDLQYVSPPGSESGPISIPLIFIENDGQSADDVLFEVISEGGTISFTENGSIIQSVRYSEDEAATASTIGFTYTGSSAVTPVEGIEPLPTTFNFMRGNNPSDWVYGASTFGSLQGTQICIPASICFIREPMTD